MSSLINIKARLAKLEERPAPSADESVEERLAEIEARLAYIERNYAQKRGPKTRGETD